MKEKAIALAERIGSVSFILVYHIQMSLSFLQENGVHTAIHSIYTYLDRASQDRASL